MKKEAIALFMAFSIGSNMTGQEERRYSPAPITIDAPTPHIIEADKEIIRLPTYGPAPAVLEKQDIILKHAKLEGIPEHIALAIVHVESSGIAKFGDGNTSFGITQVNKVNLGSSICPWSKHDLVMDDEIALACGFRLARAAINRVYEQGHPVTDSAIYCGYRNGRGLDDNGYCPNKPIKTKQGWYYPEQRFEDVAAMYKERLRG